MAFFIKAFGVKAAPSVLAYALVAFGVTVYAREAGLKAGSPGHGDVLPSVDYPIPSNFSQGVTQSCADDLEGDHSEMSQFCSAEEKLYVKFFFCCKDTKLNFHFSPRKIAQIHSSVLLCP
mmetsp:Transcript_36020/g.66388  ORF Transcript_36020/g.66388 Transcript_36020/m.66388 type:complete len:120 (+) Transcript_36020:163-522(+)